MRFFCNLNFQLKVYLNLQFSLTHFVLNHFIVKLSNFSFILRSTSTNSENVKANFVYHQNIFRLLGVKTCFDDNFFYFDIFRICTGASQNKTKL